MLWNVALRRVKNVLSLLLGRVSKQSGRRWFVSYSSRKRVRDEAHLSYLVTQYLRDHRGAFWREGMPLPSDEYGIL